MMKSIFVTGFLIFSVSIHVSESKTISKKCPPCKQQQQKINNEQKPIKQPNLNCVKKKPVVNSIEGNSKTSSSFGNIESQDYIEVNVQVNTEYKDKFASNTETFTDVEDCNCKCDCEVNDEVDSNTENRNAAAERDNQVGMHKFKNLNDLESSKNGSGYGDYDDDDDNTDNKDNNQGICETVDCPNPPCQIFCEADHGYYPDPRDCRNFCFCSGHIKVPSKFQRCAGDLVWDPSCGEQGCCNWPNDSATNHCRMI